MRGSPGWSGSRRARERAERTSAASVMPSTILSGCGHPDPAGPGRSPAGSVSPHVARPVVSSELAHVGLVLHRPVGRQRPGRSASVRGRSAGPRRRDQRPHVLHHRGADRGLLVRGPRAQGGGDDRTALAQQGADVELGLGPALHPDDHQPPLDGERVDVAGEVLGAHVVEDDVGAATVGGAPSPPRRSPARGSSPRRRPRGRGTPAASPPSRRWSRRSRRGRARAGWRRCRSRPAPPCTSSVSPGCRPATMNTLDQTVQATSGSAAAVTRSTPSGSGISCPAGTATFSAYPPPERRAQTRSPTWWPSTPSPTAETVPLHSRPMMSVAPGGGL